MSPSLFELAKSTGRLEEMADELLAFGLPRLLVPNWAFPGIRKRQERVKRNFAEQVKINSDKFESLWRDALASAKHGHVHSDPLMRELVASMRHACDTHRRVADRFPDIAERINRTNDQIDHIVQEIEAHWPWQNEEEIQESRKYFESGGAGINIRDVLNEL